MSHSTNQNKTNCFSLQERCVATTNKRKIIHSSARRSNHIQKRARQHIIASCASKERTDVSKILDHKKKGLSKDKPNNFRSNNERGAKQVTSVTQKTTKRSHHRSKYPDIQINDESQVPKLGPVSKGPRQIATCLCGQVDCCIDEMTTDDFRALVKKHAKCHDNDPISFLKQTLEWCRYDGSAWSTKQYLPIPTPTAEDEVKQHKLANICMQAINTGCVATMNRMLELGLDPNYATRFGDTFLHRACKMGAKDCFFALKQHGARPLVINDCGRTLLHDACWSSRGLDYNIVLQLMQISPDLLISQDRLSATPLDYLQDPAERRQLIELIKGNAHRFWWTRSRGDPVHLPLDRDSFGSLASRSPISDDEENVSDSASSTGRPLSPAFSTSSNNSSDSNNNIEINVECDNSNHGTNSGVFVAVR